MGKKYNKNYLSRVILKIELHDFLTINSLKEYSNYLIKILPIREEKEGISGEINFDMMSGDVRQSNKKITTWVFFSRDKKKKVGVGNSYILIEYRENSYQNSEELFRDITTIVTPFFQLNNLESAKRIGLRFINEIKLQEKDPLSWDKYITPNLTGGLTFVKNSTKKTSRLMNQIIFKEENGDLVFNYGVWNKDYPNQILEKEFVLDFDCFSNLGIARSDIETRVREYHQSIEHLFELSITDEFRKLLSK